MLVREREGEGGAGHLTLYIGEWMAVLMLEH